jgi:hypothetical protein
MSHQGSPSSKSSLRRPSGEIGIDPIENPSAAERSKAAVQEAEVLHASLKAGSIAQVVVAMIAIVGLLYLLKFVMVTGLAALLLAFLL